MGTEMGETKALPIMAPVTVPAFERSITSAAWIRMYAQTCVRMVVGKKTEPGCEQGQEQGRRPGSRQQDGMLGDEIMTQKWN